ncbi:hypothetical protein J437_LFUL003857 [Ladona fulva]|uniref:Uncharacterized protein n=1 Tax=Ladona fulva TaxID=123851 RepID=A0A8K0KF79_LADFU|nr:hypothetical protein J437_LFUL003857 [Ladona fulva]
MPTLRKMVGRNMKNCDQAVVDIQLEENLTSSSCSKVVSEIIKYLAYQKQQIPYPFEQLKLLVNKSKLAGEQETIGKSVKRRCLQLERHHSKATDAVDTLENIFKNIEAEFMISDEDGIGRVEEVVVMFGATPVTPKDVFRIQLPPVKFHSVFDTPKPPSRKTMVQLLRCLLESEDLNSIISQPIAITNAFVFFKRKSASDKLSNASGGGKRWFLPRENFRLPQKGRQAVLKIDCLPQPPQINVESPLAHPLGNISDLEDELSSSQTSMQSKNEQAKATGFLDSHPITNLFSTHLVFKSNVLEKNDCSIGSTDIVSVVEREVESLVEVVLDSIEDLSKPMEELNIGSQRTDTNFEEVNYIEWFEARVPLRGFKDYVVNGISAINA